MWTFISVSLILRQCGLVLQHEPELQTTEDSDESAKPNCLIRGLDCLSVGSSMRLHADNENSESSQ